MEAKKLYIQTKMEQKCQAHNLKVVGSNSTPATNLFKKINNPQASPELKLWGFYYFFLFLWQIKYKIEKYRTNCQT